MNGNNDVNTEINNEIPVDTSKTASGNQTKNWQKIHEEALNEELKAQASASNKETKKIEEDLQSKLEHPEYIELEEKLTRAEQKINDYWNQLLHLRAEMENLQRRTERDIANAHKYALDKFAEALLPVIDNLERSLEIKVEDNVLFNNFRAGIELTLNMFLSTIEKFGIKVVNPLGEVFNPHQHEAMSIQEDANAKPATVLKVLQKGYLLNNRLLRPAMVVVAKG